MTLSHDTVRFKWSVVSFAVPAVVVHHADSALLDLFSAETFAQFELNQPSTLSLHVVSETDSASCVRVAKPYLCMVFVVHVIHSKCLVVVRAE